MGSGRTACGWRCPNSTPMPRAVVCGRTLAADAGCLPRRSSMTRAVEIRTAMRLGEAERHRPARAARQLAHPRAPRPSCCAASSSSPSPSAAPPRTRRGRGARARRRSRAARRAAAHVPGTGRPSGTRCSSVREVEKPSAPAAHRLVDELAHRRRCRRRRPAPRRGCARPSRSTAPRSARPCRRR